jgi:hypothetical protein
VGPDTPGNWLEIANGKASGSSGSFVTDQSAVSILANMAVEVRTPHKVRDLDDAQQSIYAILLCIVRETTNMQSTLWYVKI